MPYRPKLPAYPDAGHVVRRRRSFFPPYLRLPIVRDARFASTTPARDAPAFAATPDEPPRSRIRYSKAPAAVLSFIRCRSARQSTGKRAETGVAAATRSRPDRQRQFSPTVDRGAEGLCRYHRQRASAFMRSMRLYAERCASGTRRFTRRRLPYASTLRRYAQRADACRHAPRASPP
jgi:hypothetical protein